MALLQTNPGALIQHLRPRRISILATANQSMQQQDRLTTTRRRASLLALSMLLAPVSRRIGTAQAVEAEEQQDRMPVEKQLRSELECEWKVMPSGVSFCDIVVGTGSAPSKGNVIRLHYQGKMEDGVVVDSSYDRGEPFSFQLNQETVMKGIYQAILGLGNEFPAMLPGGKRKVRVPPELGYGKNPGMCPRFWSGPCRIPPNSVLIYDLEYLGLWRLEYDTRPFHLFT